MGPARTVSIEGGSITFADALNGKGNATNFPNALTADLILTSTGDIAFQADVGADEPLADVTIVNADDVTLCGGCTFSLDGAFTQIAGTGTTDVGINSLHSGGNIDITTDLIAGSFEAGGDIDLTAAGLITLGTVVSRGGVGIDGSNIALLGSLSAPGDVLLSADSDVTIDADLAIDDPLGDGGNLTLQAGRSVILNADLLLDNGNVDIIANESRANGVNDAQRLPGDAVVTMAGGTLIDGGFGQVNITTRGAIDGTHNSFAGTTLANIQAAGIQVTATGIEQFNDVTGLITVSGALTSTAGVDLSATDLDILPGGMISAADSLTITRSAFGNVHIGDTGPVSISIDQAELNRISAASLVFGDVDPGLR